jgi:hypothetical protein
MGRDGLRLGQVRTGRDKRHADEYVASNQHSSEDDMG